MTPIFINIKFQQDKVHRGIYMGTGDPYFREHLPIAFEIKCMIFFYDYDFWIALFQEISPREYIPQTIDSWGDF